MVFSTKALFEAVRVVVFWVAYSLLFAILLSIPDLAIYLQDESFRPSLKSYRFTATLSAVAPYLWRLSVGRGVLLFFLLVSYAELVYFQYFGVMFGPPEIWLLYVEFAEVMLGMTDLPLGGFVALLGLGGAIAVVILLKKFVGRPNYLLHIIWLPLSLFVIAKPVLGIWADNPWSGAIYNPDVRYAVLKNGFNAAFWSLIKYIPAQVSAAENGKTVYADYSVRENARKNYPSIILVLGESINPDRMSLFGHERNTTPGLEGLLKTYQGSYARAMSSATMTRVSLPMFLNVVREPDNYRAHRQGQFNLFHLAKQRGYRTLFVSTQKMDGLSSLIGMRHIDYWRDAMTKGGEGVVVDDAALPGFAEKLLDGTDQPVFAVINPRVAHVPYTAYVPEGYRKYSQQAGLEGLEKRRAQYDDAISYFDHVVTESLEVMLKKISGPVVVLLISDHGERLGESAGKLGHGVVHFDVGKTPFMIFQRGETLGGEMKKMPCPRTHYDIGVLIGQILGYDFENPNDDGKRFLNGTDLNGIGGFQAYDPGSVGFLQEECQSYAPRRRG